MTLTDPSGATVWWDRDIQTYCGILAGQRVGTHAGHIVTVSALAQALGVTLHADTCAALGEQFAAAPWVAPDRKISKLAFRGRFSQPERVALELASTHDYAQAIDSPRNVLAATLRSSNADLASASGDVVDLADERTRAGVVGLEQAGLLGSGRALEILDAPIADAERIAK